MWKKRVALGLVVMMAFAGCSSSAGDVSSMPLEGNITSSAAPSIDQEAPGHFTEGGEGGLKIAIVTSPSDVNDGSFNQDNYEGILAFLEGHPDASVTAVQEPTGEAEASVQAVSEIATDYDVIC